ncbi:hypothetical protein [Epilithonimonas tenax]|uniref:hypothetical protein n=1 Tax=Epilithonimonas tenax TaxID=191577 RepID=UPI000404E064|nr:hypothetical protein [Epilithonimonas tenax]
MEFRRRTKRLSGLPIAFYVVALLFFVLLFSFNSLYYKASEETKPSVEEVPVPAHGSTKNSVEKPEIYVPDVEILPADTASIAKETIPAPEETLKSGKTIKEDQKPTQKDEKRESSIPDSENKITKIGKDRILTAFIPGTMGKAGKLPSHNCKAKGQLVMFITVDKAGNVTSAGRSSGIKEVCNVTAAVIWTKKYVKAKKAQNISQGTYTIVF